MLPGPKDPPWRKGCKKKTGFTPLVGLMDPYTIKERGFFKCYRVRRTHVWRIRVQITCGGKGLRRKKVMITLYIIKKNPIKQNETKQTKKNRLRS